MKLEFNKEQLLELMKDFYILTGIRIVLFDDEYQELLSYPKKDCRFCHLIKQHPSTCGLCSQSDRHSFEQCKAERKLIIYHCHAGLIEAAVPLIDNHIVIGYLMFGQISDVASYSELNHILAGNLPNPNFFEAISDLMPVEANMALDALTREISLKTTAEIHAAAKIMEACTFYALLNETVALRRQDFTNHLQSLLLSHLNENLDAGTVAKLLGVSRSNLYISCDQYLGMGIAEYIRTLRLETAKKLLKETSLTVTQVAEKVGFGDYNYFCRVFKKETGYSAKKYRNLYSH